MSFRSLELNPINSATKLGYRNDIIIATVSIPNNVESLVVIFCCVKIFIDWYLFFCYC